MNIARPHTGIGFALAALLAVPHTLHAQAPWYALDRWNVELTVDLASGLPDEPPAPRDSILDRLADEMQEVELQAFILENAWTGEALADYPTSVVPASEDATDLLWAFWETLVRLRGAEAAGDPEWVRTHLAAMRTFAARASEALQARADEDERQARTLEAYPFARRSSRAEAEAALTRIRTDGLPDAQRRLFLEGGLGEEELAAFEASVLATPADALGRSIVEHYDALTALRRELAASLLASVHGGYPLAASYRHTFTVGNPKDHPATVDLSILPASVPPGWRFALVGADSLDSSGAPLNVYEDEPGRRYRVHLPAGASARVATSVVPLSAVGEGTTVRWSVEGRIGGELLGGIVQEMRVPGGSVTPAADPGTPLEQKQPAWLDGYGLLLIAVAVLLFILLLLFTFRRRFRTGRAISS